MLKTLSGSLYTLFLHNFKTLFFKYSILLARYSIYSLLEGERNRGDKESTAKASPAASTLNHQLVQDEHLAMECLHATSFRTS
jgi:hypothetical protein